MRGDLYINTRQSPFIFENMSAINNYRFLAIYGSKCNMCLLLSILPVRCACVYVCVFNMYVRA